MAAGSAGCVATPDMKKTAKPAFTSFPMTFAGFAAKHIHEQQKKRSATP